MKRAFAFSFVMLPLALAASQASAQTNGYAVNRFDPAEKGSDWFANESLDLRGKLRPAIGVIGDYNSNQIVYRNYDGSTQSQLVSRDIYIHVGASLTIADRLRLGVNVPVALYQHGETSVLNGTTLTPPSKAAIGDVRLGGDLRLVGEYKDPFTMAIGAQVYLPTGIEDQYTGDGKVAVQPRLTVAGDVSIIAYAAKIGFLFRGRADEFAGTKLGDSITGSAAIGLRALDHHLLIGPEIFAQTLASKAFNHIETPMEALLGVHYQANDWKFGLGAGGGLGDIYSSPSLRLLAGIEWTPAMEDPPKDRDGDGILDKDDACPDVAGVATDDPKTNGCPARLPDDRDGDGVLDRDDACPDVPGVKTDDPKTNGCPADKDGDGIPDNVDACPDVAGVKSDDPKKNGCPALAAISNGQIRISEQVQFKTGSATILPASTNLMTAVMDIMKEHTELKMVHVEGHTDNKGTAKGNKVLSQKRAEAVVGWLVMHGIEKSRMDAKGYGQERPIDTNETDAGRQNNRRVEFHIEGGSSGGGTR